MTSSGKFVVIGASESNNGDVSGNHGQHDFWVVKLAPDPLLVSEFDANLLKLYPNPVTRTLNIEAMERIERIVIFDLLGQKLLERSPNTLKTEIDMEHLAVGTYIIQLVSNNSSDSFKIISIRREVEDISQSKNCNPILLTGEWVLVILNLLTCDFVRGIARTPHNGLLSNHRGHQKSTVLAFHF